MINDVIKIVDGKSALSGQESERDEGSDETPQEAAATSGNDKSPEEESSKVGVISFHVIFVSFTLVVKP